MKLDENMLQFNHQNTLWCIEKCCIFIGWPAGYISLCIGLEPLIYITWFKWFKWYSPASTSSSIGFLSYYGLPGYFLVLIGKISMFFLEKLRIELKCHHSNATDVDIFTVFYYTKTTSDTKQTFRNVITVVFHLWIVQLNLPMWSPLLSRSPFFLFCHRKFHMNWTSVKRSPVL
jgi:hypothetical protein